MVGSFKSWTNYRPIKHNQFGFCGDWVGSLVIVQCFQAVDKLFTSKSCSNLMVK